jgi:hypothetical protein
LKSNFENVALVGLNQEKEHGFGFVCGAANKYHATIRIVQVGLTREEIETLELKKSTKTTENAYSSSRYGTLDVHLVAKVLVNDIIFTAYQHATWSFIATWYGDEKIRKYIQRLGILSDDVVETQVQFVEREVLFERGWVNI